MSAKPTIEVEYGGYGFVHNWVLVLPATKTLSQRCFYLGQDVKFCSRVLGMSCRELSDAIGEGWEPLRCYRPSTMNKVAAYIVRCFGGMRAMRKQDDWDYCCE